MRTGLGKWLIAAAAVALPGEAWAQSATVRSVIRVVKSAPSGAAAFREARIGTEVGAGGRVRTGGRSGAGLRFPDQTIIRLGELTEIEVTSPGSRNVKVNRGKLFGDYRRPGTITGGYAVAAVRGTKPEFIEDGDKEHVRCYGGIVYVASADNPIYAGATNTVGETSLTDPALVTMNIDWTGGEVRFTGGPFRGQVRGVTAFDPAAGALTLDAALAPADPGAGPSDYIVSKLRGRKIVALTRNTGTTVRRGGEPEDPYSVPGEQFANVERYPYFRRLSDGRALYTFPGSIEHDEMRREYFGQRLAIEQLSTRREEVLEDPFCDVIVTRPPQNRPTSAARMGVRSHLRRRLEQDCGPDGALALSPAGERGGSGRALTALSAVGKGSEAAPAFLAQTPGPLRLAQGGPFGLAQAAAFGLAQAAATAEPAGEGGRLPTPEQIVLPRQVRPTDQFRFDRSGAFRFEPFVIGSDEGEALGARARVQATHGEIFAEFGYLFRSVNDDLDHDLSEAFVHLRGSYGDLMLGRQHLFLRMSNNQDIGALLGLDSTDAFVYQLPLPDGYRQMAGYILNSQAIGTGSYPGNFSGAFARGQAPLAGGIVGYTLLGSDDFPDIGWSLDAAMPVVRNVIDLYGEAGIDPAGRNLFTGGLYIPALYHAAKVDAFIEYAHRENIQDRVSLRLRRELGSGLLIVAFLDHVSKSGFDGGGGIVWSMRFR